MDTLDICTQTHIRVWNPFAKRCMRRIGPTKLRRSTQTRISRFFSKLDLLLSVFCLDTIGICGSLPVSCTNHQQHLWNLDGWCGTCLEQMWPKQARLQRLSIVRRDDRYRHSRRVNTSPKGLPRYCLITKTWCCNYERSRRLIAKILWSLSLIMYVYMYVYMNMHVYIYIHRVCVYLVRLYAHINTADTAHWHDVKLVLFYQ